MDLMHYSSKLERYWYGKESRFPFPVHELLSIASGGWMCATAVREVCARPRKVKPLTVGISSLTVGGGGKTPLVRWIAEELHSRGIRVAIVSRGYGGGLHVPVHVLPGIHSATEVGDEPLFLSRRLPAGIPVIVSKDRYEGCLFADTHFNPKYLVLDDTIMQTSVKLDTEILVQGSAGGIGNGRCLPAGPLRKPVETVRRMHAIVLIGEDLSAPQESGKMRIPTYHLPVFHTRLVPRSIRNTKGDTVPVSSLENRPVAAWAGMARPWRFRTLLRRLGANVVFFRSFTDHHVYSRKDIDTLKRAVNEKDLLPITTEKDIVRFPSESGLFPYTLDIGLEFDYPNEFIAVLSEAM